jgi:hypothetical protein
VHSAKDWKSILEPIVERYRDRDILRFFRGDAVFGNPNVHSYLEAEQYDYAIRLRSNDILNLGIEHLMTRPVGRPPKTPIVLYHEFMYRAAARDRERRVIAKVEWHRGELFPALGSLSPTFAGDQRTSFGSTSIGNGSADDQGGQNTVKWTRFSCHDFADNQVRLQLFALAYNLGNFFRQTALPKSIRHWTMTTLREKVIKGST